MMRQDGCYGSGYMDLCVAEQHNEVFFWTYMPKGGVEFWFHA